MFHRIEIAFWEYDEDNHGKFKELVKTTAKENLDSLDSLICPVPWNS